MDNCIPRKSRARTHHQRNIPRSMNLIGDVKRPTSLRSHRSQTLLGSRQIPVDIWKFRMLLQLIYCEWGHSRSWSSKYAGAVILDVVSQKNNIDGNAISEELQYDKIVRCMFCQMHDARDDRGDSGIYLVATRTTNQRRSMDCPKEWVIYTEEPRHLSVYQPKEIAWSSSHR